MYRLLFSTNRAIILLFCHVRSRYNCALCLRKGRTIMKLELSVMVHSDSSFDIFVGTSDGVYLVNFEHNHICFEEGAKVSDLLIGDVSVTSEFTEDDLIPKKEFEGVRHYHCATATIGRFFKKDIIMEYLDTSNGKIPRHTHSDGVMEVYLSLDPPHIGKICGFGEFHEPFCNHTIAVKVIYRR